MKKLLAILILASSVVNCRKQPEPAASHPGRGEPAEQVGNLWLYQLYSDHFDALPQPLKQYAYHIYRAGLAGRDITYDQLAPWGLEIRQLLDNMAVQPADDDTIFQRQFDQYRKRFWAFNGNYDPETRVKFVPEFTADRLAQRLERLGLAGKFESLRPFIFNIAFLPVLVTKNTTSGNDPVSASAVNFYDRGLTRKEVEGFSSRYGLNSRLTKTGGQIVEEVYRAGAPDVAPGRMTAALENVISELETAREYAPDKSRTALTELIRYFRTGKETDFIHHQQLWVADNRSPVDYIFGFVEVYDDPLGKRGTFEAMVLVEDSAMSRAMTALAGDAAWFEARMPWADEFKKHEFTLPTARAFEVLGGFGDGGPQCPWGINLPNFQHLRETIGTKNFLLTNVMETGAEERGRKILAEFLPTREQLESATAFYMQRTVALVALHEVTGHGSGKVSAAVGGNPDAYLKEFASTLEEARADLTAYWFIGDSHLVSLEVIPAGLSREGAYRAMLAHSIANLRDVPTGDRLEEDHARGGWMNANWIVAHGGAVDTVINGKNYRLLTDLDKAHEAVGDLLAEIMRIKATGDFIAARKLVETYGIRFDPNLRDEVRARLEPLGLPERVAFIMPELELVQNKMGGVKDVKISYPRDFKGQMVRFGKMNNE